MGKNNNNGNTTIIQQITVINNYYISDSKTAEINSRQEDKPTTPAKPVEKKSKLPWYQFWFTFLQWLLPYIPALAKFIKHPT